MRSVLVLALVASAALTGCQTHECDSSSIVVDDTDGAVPLKYLGGVVVWESAPELGTWLDYPGAGTITFKFPASFRPADYKIDAYISTAADQGSSGATSTPASGQLAEITSKTPSGFSITNQSCAEYFLRVVVTPFTATPPTPDASRD